MNRFNSKQYVFLMIMMNSNRDVLNITSSVVCSNYGNHGLSIFLNGGWFIL